MSTAATVKSVHNPDRILVRFTLLVTSTLTVMTGATIAPALPAMRDHFGGVANADLLVRLVLTLPALFIAMIAPVSGYIVDRFGRKKLLVATTALYAVAGSSGYVLNSLTAILVGRAFLGIAVAGLMTSVTTLIVDYFQGPARARFLGFQAAFMGLGGTVFLSLGGFLADMGWRQPFLVYLSATMILPFVMLVLYEPQHNHLATNTSNVPNTFDEPTAILFPYRLAAFTYANVVMIQIALTSIVIQLPFHLKTLTNATASQSGLTIAFMTLFFACGSSVFSRVNRRFGQMPTLVLALLLAGTAFTLLSLATGWPLILMVMPLAGLGAGLMTPNLNVWLANETPMLLRGRALGLFTTSLFLGQFVSPLITVPVSHAVNGIGPMYAVIGIFLLVLGGVLASFQRQLVVWLSPVPAGESQLALSGD